MYIRHTYFTVYLRMSYFDLVINGLLRARTKIVDLDLVINVLLRGMKKNVTDIYQKHYFLSKNSN